MAVIGGSSVHHDVRKGTEVNFPTWLQRALPEAEVLNLGAPGLTSAGVLTLVEALRALPAGSLDLLVVYTGHNDFSDPLFRGRVGQPGAAEEAFRAVLQHSWAYQNLLGGTQALLSPTRADPMAPLFVRDTRAATWREPTLETLESNLRRVVARSPAPVVLSTLVRSFDAPPVGVVLRDTHPRCARTVRGLPRTGLSEPALYAARVAAQCGADQALESWYRAHAAAQEDDLQQAAEHFATMRRLDPLPLSAPAEAEGVVVHVAAETGCAVWRAGDALGPLPSGAFFDDLLHPSEAGARRLGEHLAPLVRRQLVAAGVLPGVAGPTGAPEDQTGAADQGPPRDRSR